MRRLPVTLLVSSLVAGPFYHASAQHPCASLATGAVPHLTVTQAVEVPAGKLEEWDSLPRFCRVVGVLSPIPASSIAFEIWLPVDTWNGKLSALGHGGFAGYINYDQPVGGGMVGQLRRGYAATSTNTGHEARPGAAMARFAFDNPEALIDFAWRAQHEGAVAAKAVVEWFYGRPPAHSYFFGGSSGGRQALISAQRFPDDYDGIVASAPAFEWTTLFAAALDLHLDVAADSTVRMPRAMLERVAAATVAACDGDDGAVDGILWAPQRCQFDLESLACRTAGATTDCLNPAQRAWIRRAHDGLRHPLTDSLMVPGFERGFERGLNGYITALGPLVLAYYRWVAQRDSTWSFASVAPDPASRAAAIFKDVERLAPLMDATDPDLAAFHARGGKLILSHGWNDELIAPRATINYFERVVTALGGNNAGWQKADGFMRLFLVPMRHHTGWNHNLQTALEDWVENGRAPDMLEETIATANGTEVVRRLCRYRSTAAATLGTTNGPC